VTQDNLYLGAARNRGVRDASGELILFLDDDNIALPRMVESLARAVKSSDVAVSGHVVWKQGESTKVFSTEKVWLPVGPVPYGGIKGRSFVGSANFLITKRKFLQLGGFNEERSSWEDFEFHSRAVHEGASYAVVPEPLMLYRMHSSSQMSQVGDNSRNAARIARLYNTDTILAARAASCTLTGFTLFRTSASVGGNFNVACLGNPTYITSWMGTVNVYSDTPVANTLVASTTKAGASGGGNFKYQFTTACTSDAQLYRAELVFTGTDVPTAIQGSQTFSSQCPLTKK
jgi:glycosyltransferase involved in cell wall biosynthesis